MAALSRAVAAQPDACALIVAETGAGKGVLSRMIHRLSPQSRAPFVRVNVVDIEPAELEQKLFGGADVGEGLLAAARGGTLMVRELSELDERVRDKFRRLLETRRYCTPPSTAERSFHARLLVTSPCDPDRLIRDYRLDPGLVYRLASFTIRVPPLRERAEDLARIAEAILRQVAAEASRPGLRLSDGAIDMTIGHPWPGNLREMRNVLTRLALLCPDDLIGADDLARALGYTAPIGSREGRGSGIAPKLQGRRSRAPSSPVPRISGIPAQSLDEPARAERERIEAALEAADGHRERAALILGMSRTTLWTRMRMLGVDHERFHCHRAKAQ
jgi:DNA-binding NtrC family response regulator